ncbi:hypothetical protein HHI36_009838 [Cryptolaemus montrouzieri]|uniref:Uncharacterized protein n=1 Tax=Cryptolaemus montrouzieri TaxID=559131 RepID=A0ABD2MGX5_9CUCU
MDPNTENVIVHEDESSSSGKKQPDQDFNGSWSEPNGNHRVFEYNSEAGLSPNYAAVIYYDLYQYSCFRASLDENIMRYMVDQTNLYATQIPTESEKISNIPDYIEEFLQMKTNFLVSLASLPT